MAAGNSYPAVQLDSRGKRVDSGVTLQFTDSSRQPGSGGGSQSVHVYSQLITNADLGAADFVALSFSPIPATEMIVLVSWVLLETFNDSNASPAANVYAEDPDTVGTALGLVCNLAGTPDVGTGFTTASTTGGGDVRNQSNLPLYPDAGVPVPVFVSLGWTPALDGTTGKVAVVIQTVDKPV